VGSRRLLFRTAGPFGREVKVLKYRDVMNINLGLPCFWGKWCIQVNIFENFFKIFVDKIREKRLL